MPTGNDLDVTEQVKFGDDDDKYLSLTQCVCGRVFRPWIAILSIYRDCAVWQCPECGRELYFRSTIRVYEVNDADGE